MPSERKGNTVKQKQFIGLLIVDDKGNKYVVDGPDLPDGIDIKKLYKLADDQEFPFLIPEVADAWCEIEDACITDQDAYDRWLDAQD